METVGEMLDRKIEEAVWSAERHLGHFYLPILIFVKDGGKGVADTLALMDF